MFWGKMSDNLIVKTHYRTLRAIYDTQTGSYEELLHLSGKKKIHTQNLQILMAEAYKCLKNISPPFTWDYFKQKDTPYHLRNTQLLELSKCRTKTYGLNKGSTLFKGSILWNKLPNHLKEAKSLINFKNKIQERTGRSCTVLVVYALELSTFKKYTYVNFFFCCNIYIKYIYIYIFKYYY